MNTLYLSLSFLFISLFIFLFPALYLYLLFYLSSYQPIYLLLLLFDGKLLFWLQQYFIQDQTNKTDS